MVYDLLHADPVRAFHDNALLLACTPFLLAVAGRWAVAGLRGRRWRPVLGARVVRRGRGARGVGGAAEPALTAARRRATG